MNLIVRTCLTVAIILTHNLAHADDDVLVAESKVDWGKGVSESHFFLSQAKKGPEWDTESTPPPLRPKEAQRIALRHLERNAVQEKLRLKGSWQVFETALVNVHGTSIWYYSVKVFCAEPGSGGRRSMEVFVTMDGDVAPIRVQDAQ